MKKQYVYLLLLSGILAVMIFLLIKAREGDIDSTLDGKYSDFAIEDTSSIDKIVIENAQGERAELTKVDQDHWKVNGKYKARIDAIRNIMQTARLISVKSEVSESAKDNVIKTISASFIKVEYWSDGDILKSWYIGSATRDHQGTYMLLERGEDERSTVPYITEIKGFFGFLGPRFFTDEKEWRDKVIWKLEPSDISSVELENNEDPEYSFKIDVKGKNDFALSGKNGIVNGFDTVNVRSYLLNFRKIAFETFNRGILNPEQEDSLRKAIPFAILTVKEKSGKTISIKAYRKAPTPDQVDLAGESYQWDVERLFAILPSGEIVIMQYGTFDKIWRALVNFTK